MRFAGMVEKRKINLASGRPRSARNFQLEWLSRLQQKREFGSPTLDRKPLAFQGQLGEVHGLILCPDGKCRVGRRTGELDFGRNFDEPLPRMVVLLVIDERGDRSSSDTGDDPYCIARRDSRQ